MYQIAKQTVSWRVVNRVHRLISILHVLQEKQYSLLIFLPAAMFVNSSGYFIA